jgi:hypothetical protein
MPTTLPPTNTDAVTLNAQAQKGLDYLKTANPGLASSILSTGGFNQIDASKLSGGSQFNLPAYTAPTIPTTAPPPIDFGVAGKQSAVDTSLADLKAVEDQQGQETARRSQLEANYAADLSNLDSHELQSDLKSQDRFAPTFAISGEQAQAARQKAFQAQSINIQRATNAAVITSAQGHLSLAQDYITKALDAEFTPLASKIDYLKTVLNMNQDNLSKAEQAQLQQKITDNQRSYDEARQNKTDIYNILLTAAQNGADAKTMDAIKSATNPQEAATAAATVLGQKFKDDKAQQTFDNNIKLAQLAIDRAKLKNETAAATSDPAQILAYAQQYAGDGKIPTGLPKGTFGVVSQVAKELPKPDGTLVSNTTGVAPNSLSSTEIDGIASLRDLQKKLDDAKTLYGSYNHGVLAGIKNKVFPSTGEQQYQNLRGEIIDLLARARTGAAISATEEATYSAKLPGDFNKSFFVGQNGTQKIDDLKSSLSGKLNTTLQTHNVSIYGYSTVNLGGQQYTVGQTVTNAQGQQGRINADGTITLIQ